MSVWFACNAHYEIYLILNLYNAFMHLNSSVRLLLKWQLLVLACQRMHSLLL